MVERKHGIASSCALVRLLALLLALWSPSCGSPAVDPSMGPAVGTETGNPSYVRAGAFRLVAVNDEWVEVVAEAGSVYPGGSEVVIFNADSGQRTTVRANEDGSLRARVSGAATDRFTVDLKDERSESPPVEVLPEPRAELAPSDASATTGTDEPTRDAGGDASSEEERPATLPPLAGPSVIDATRVDAGAAPPSSAEAASDAGTSPAPVSSAAQLPTGPTVIDVERLEGAATQGRPETLGASTSALQASCEELRTQASAARQAAIDGVSRACRVDADCADVTDTTLVACVASCDVVVASVASSSSLESATERTQTQYCLPFIEQGCPLPAFDTCPVELVEPRCVAAACVNAPRASVP